MNERLEKRFGFRCDFRSGSTTVEQSPATIDQKPKKVVPPAGGSLPYMFPATADWRAHWNVYSTEIPNEVPYYLDNLEVLKDSSEQFPEFVRIHFPKGSGSPHVAHNFGKKPAGILARFVGGVPSGHSDLYLRYDIRIPSSYHNVEGMELPGLFGGLVVEPDGRGRFESGIVLNKEGRADIYGKYQKSYRAKGSPVSEQAITADNTWHRIDMRMKLNDVASKGGTPQNGSVEIWIDGEKSLLKDGLVFRADGKYTIDGLYFSSIFGSTKVNDLVKEDTYLDFANFTVSDKPIE